MKKITVLSLITLLVLVTVFVGCRAQDGKTSYLPPCHDISIVFGERIANDSSFSVVCDSNEHDKIAYTYAELNNVDKSDVDFVCYGNFNGTHVLMICGVYDDAITYETVGEAVFCHSQVKYFTVYDSGEFYSLQEAYDMELLSYKDLLTLQRNYSRMK